jgi:UDP-glucuronate decarboxylase
VELNEIDNLPCVATPVNSQENPVDTTQTNVHDAINMLGQAKRLGARIFQALTSEVYGGLEVSPRVADMRERHNARIKLREWSA